MIELRLEDYRPFSHEIDETDLLFELKAEDNVVVTTRMKGVHPNPKSNDDPHVIALNGAPETVSEGSAMPRMQLLEVKLDSIILSSEEYIRNEEGLVIANLPDRPFTLEITTRINPKENRSLAGLYLTGNKLMTQNESQGFRNITFFPDRPDVLSKYTTTIVAPKDKYPQLLSNGNPGERTTTEDGRDKITWVDPFRKPSYLFALVAGDMAFREAMFTTQSGRKVKVRIYTDHGNEDKVEHAMNSALKFLKWDEDTYGYEYDLDLLQIAVTDDFNFGAMENKGLLIFNTTTLLADSKVATDSRYKVVERVLGHEIAHNITGNRITVANWFQISLKEGLTSLREEEFSSDMNNRDVNRIEAVSEMRERQFPEDASAVAHSIRPSVVGSVENCYTTTIYEKGAEVIRMIQTMIGKDNFLKGMRLYYERHDGSAVTTEDFVKAMADASGLDLAHFERTWYNQAGTPTLDVTDGYDPDKKEYKLTIKQSTPSTPGQIIKEPFHIPVRVGLLDCTGNDMALELIDTQTNLLTQGDVLNLTEPETSFIFKNVSEKPVPSLLRNWSAPVKLNYAYSRDDLSFLMAHDSVGFNRWEAGNKLGVEVLLELVAAQRQGKQKIGVDYSLISAFQGVLQDKTLNGELTALSVCLPNEDYLAEMYLDGDVDPEAIHAAREHAKTAIGQALEPLFLKRYNDSRSTERRPYEWNGKDAAERAVKNSALDYLIAADPDKYLPLALAQFDLNHNITDVRPALRHIINNADAKTREAKLDVFYQNNKTSQLAINQWFVDQALAKQPDVLHQVKRLLSHSDYKPKQPNCVRSLVGGFAANVIFHRKDGSGYEFLAKQAIDIDKFNPVLAAGLALKLASPHRYDNVRQELMKAQLERIRDNTESPNVQEIVLKSLGMLASRQGAQAAPQA